MKSGCIETFSGIMFDPLDPDIDLIRIEDIANSLAMQCRFNGHCEKFYSVAEHSVNSAKVAEILFPEKPIIAKFALLHDASEAYLCDIPRPLKASFAKYLDWEKTLSDLIFEKFVKQIPSDADDEMVLRADNIILATESFHLASSKGQTWNLPEQKCDEIEILCLQPEEAKELFMHEFDRLI